MLGSALMMISARCDIASTIALSESTTASIATRGSAVSECLGGMASRRHRMCESVSNGVMICLIKIRAC